jgi:hypothetical protein
MESSKYFFISLPVTLTIEPQKSLQYCVELILDIKAEG